MQIHYNENQQPDLIGLESAVQQHARELQRMEMDATINTEVVQ